MCGLSENQMYSVHFVQKLGIHVFVKTYPLVCIYFHLWDTAHKINEILFLITCFCWRSFARILSLTVSARLCEVEEEEEREE